MKHHSMASGFSDLQKLFLLKYLLVHYKCITHGMNMCKYAVIQFYVKPVTSHIVSMSAISRQSLSSIIPLASLSLYVQLYQYFEPFLRCENIHLHFDEFTEYISKERIQMSIDPFWWCTYGIYV